MTELSEHIDLSLLTPNARALVEGVSNPAIRHPKRVLAINAFRAFQSGDISSDDLRLLTPIDKTKLSQPSTRSMAQWAQRAHQANIDDGEPDARTRQLPHGDR